MCKSQFSILSNLQRVNAATVAAAAVCVAPSARISGGGERIVIFTLAPHPFTFFFLILLVRAPATLVRIAGAVRLLAALRTQTGKNLIKTGASGGEQRVKTDCVHSIFNLCGHSAAALPISPCHSSFVRFFVTKT